MFVGLAFLQLGSDLDVSFSLTDLGIRAKTISTWIEICLKTVAHVFPARVCQRVDAVAKL